VSKKDVEPCRGSGKHQKENLCLAGVSANEKKIKRDLKESIITLFLLRPRLPLRKTLQNNLHAITQQFNANYPTI